MKLPNVPRPRTRGVSLLLDGLIAAGVVFVIAREFIRSTAFASLTAAVGRRQLHGAAAGGDYLLGLAFGLVAFVAMLALIAIAGVVLFAHRRKSSIT